MHDTGTIFGGHKIAEQYSERICRRFYFSGLLASKGTIVHNCMPSSSLPLNSANIFQGNNFIAVFICIKIAILTFGFEIFAHQVFCQHYIDRQMSIWIKGFYQYIIDIRPYGESQVGRKRPGSGGPGQKEHFGRLHAAGDRFKKELLTCSSFTALNMATTLVSFTSL